MRKRFGRAAWCNHGSASGDEPFYERVRPPVGVPCMHCEEPFTLMDDGEMVPHWDGEGGAAERPWHRECLLRSVLGSVGHQLRKCSCFGGEMEDPPGFTKRECAMLAMGISMCLRRKDHEVWW